MTNLKFKEWQCHDDRPALCQEEALQRTLGFAGIHAYAVSSWLLGAYTPSVSENVVSDVSHLDIVSVVDEDLELGFWAEFDWSSPDNDGAFVFCADDALDCYFAWWNDGEVGFSKVTSGAETELVRLPLVVSSPSRVRVGVWPKSYTKIDEIDDLAMGIWLDDRLLLAHAAAYTEKGKRIGFGVNVDGHSATYSNIRVPQLHQITEWTSVDPGESASAGMNRVVGQSQIRVQARYDGSAKIWRNTETDVDWEVSLGRATQATVEHGFYAPSHLRMVGALHEINVFRENDQGHTFVVVQDPNALSEDDTYNRAIRRHVRVAEGGDKLVLGMAPNVLLEAEDVIRYNGEKWRVSTIVYRIARRGEGEQVAVLESLVTCRRCLE